jgi:methyl-accepting chemotaxis protein
MARRTSLQTKISVIFSVFITALIGAIIVLIGLSMTKEVDKLVLASNEQISIARAKELGEMMDKLKWQLMIMSSRDVFHGGEADKIEAAVMAQKKYISPEVIGAFYIWQNGDYFTTEGARANIADRDYYKEIFVDGKKESIGKAVISKALNAPIVVTAVAISGPNGKNKAAVAFQFRLEELSQVVGDIKVGKTGYGWIVDRDGMVIAHANPQAIMNLNILDADKDGYKNLNVLGKRIVTEDKGVGSFINKAGVKMITFFVRVPNTPGWGLGISVPEKEIKESVNQLVMLLIIIAFFSIVLAAIISIQIAKTIVKPLKVICAAMDDFAGGDFTLANVDEKDRLKIDARKDELGDLSHSLREMLDSLTTIVTQIIDAANQVSAGSGQLSSTSQSISQGATEQAASVEEISSSMEQMSANIKQNAENAQTTESIARKSAQSAEAGGQAVLQTVEAMKKIASKIGIIEEIARSTNMLSLNASIEAARAGEYGKGFAVVASEVGKLAERSSREAAEINHLSVNSLKIAEVAGQTITDMVPEIKRTADLVQEISAASREQDSGANQINSAITQLDQVVQQNASASEESASMSEELAGQAQTLKETISFFRIDTSAGDRQLIQQ